MHKVRTASADVLAYRAGTVTGLLAGALVGAAGVVLFKVATAIPGDRATVVGLLVLVSIGLFLGGACSVFRALGQSGIILDRSGGNVTTWRRKVVPTSSRIRDLAAFRTVLLSTARLQKRFTSGTVYLVGLHGDTGEPLPLHWDEDYLVARRFAEEVADFLSFPFTDASGTEAVVHTPGEPNRPLSQMEPMACIGALPPPAGMQCRVSWQGTTLVIEEPPMRWLRLIGSPLVLFLCLALPCLGFGVYAHLFEINSTVFAGPLLASLMVVGMLFLIFLAVVLSSLPQLSRRRVVEAARDYLRFKTEGLFAARDRSLRSEDVGELRIAFGHLSAITPRDYRVVCGRLDNPLARAELEWLRDQLARALKGQAAS